MTVRDLELENENLKEAIRFLKRLVFLARTTGGTAGPDELLKEALSEAEPFLNQKAQFYQPSIANINPKKMRQS